MKVGIVGIGFVGTACAKAMLLRGSCQRIVLVDVPERESHTYGVANDLSHAAVLCPHTEIEVGGYEQLADADVVAVTAGINEQAGGATDPNDPWGRLRLLAPNSGIYRDIVPRLVRAGYEGPIVVVTDPPDPLADVTLDIVRQMSAGNPVLSTGTFLDSIRFRLQLAKRLDCTAKSVDAMVIGEHGRSQVYVWSSARIGSRLVTDLIADLRINIEKFKDEVQQAVRYANIQIIKGTGASQHGIGTVTARIVEAMLRDEHLVEPIGSFQADFGLTLSFPGRITARGVAGVPRPSLSAQEADGLAAGAALIAKAVRIAAEGGSFETALA
jgi:L-lactate dehydrogenase